MVYIPKNNPYGGTSAPDKFANVNQFDDWVTRQKQTYQTQAAPPSDDGSTTFPHPGQNPPPPTNPGDGPVTEPPVTGVPAPPASGGGNIWDEIGYGPDIFDFDTRPPDPGAVPQFPWFTGDGGPNVVTGEPGPMGSMTMLNPDGSVTPGQVGPITRNVQGNELVSEQLSGLLNSDSKLIQDARRQGLEQANALGGLGGTVGVGASMQAAMRTALPIAQSDAEAYRAAAAQNLDALNQFGQLNHQRATQLELGQIDARTRQLTTQITTSAQMAAAQLESATQRDLGRLDSETKLRLTEMSGKIQDRLASAQFQYTALLNDANNAAELARTVMQGDYGLAGVGLKGQWDAAIQEKANAAEREGQYLQLMTGAYDNYLNRIADLNGMEMDDAARERAIASIAEGARAMFSLLSKLYPGVEPIEFEL